MFIHSEEAQLLHEISPTGHGIAFLQYPTFLQHSPYVFAF